MYGIILIVALSTHWQLDIESPGNAIRMEHEKTVPS
jgi:hypothetical protein